MATTRKRRKNERHLLNDTQRLMITVWTKLGGYSNRAIASKIFGSNPSQGEIQAVSGFKFRNGLSCLWWRNMETPIAQKYADGVLGKAVKALKHR